MRTATRNLVGKNTFFLIFGSFIVGIWTIIRFFNRGPNFDQVGQQVLAHQWLSGLHAGSVIGPTNYVIKMIFLYMPFDMLPLPGQLKLILMTLLINVATFLLLAYSLKLIWRELFGVATDSLYPSLVYLALLSGSVYWISYANSRNLEVAGGVFLIYLYLKAHSHPSKNMYLSIVGLGSILFFADPLQIYMTLLPVLIFIIGRAFKKLGREHVLKVITLVGCSLISALFAHFLKVLVENIWSITFIKNPQSINFSASSVKSAVGQMAKLYAGGYEGGRAREILDLLVVAGTILFAVYLFWRKPKTRLLASLAFLVWAVDFVIYILSGQAQQGDTNRYLIMTVPMFVLLMSACLYYLSPKARVYMVSVVLLLNTLTLAGALVKGWNPTFSQSKHARLAANYMESQRINYGYASINTALSGDYLSGGKVNLLPIGCDADFVLKKTNLFFDKASFNIEKSYDDNKQAPIILDGNNIRINQATCGVNQIQKQLGRAQGLDHLSDGSLVLFYSQAQLSRLRPVSATP